MKVTRAMLDTLRLMNGLAGGRCTGIESGHAYRMLGMGLIGRDGSGKPLTWQITELGRLAVQEDQARIEKTAKGSTRRGSSRDTSKPQAVERAAWAVDACRLAEAFEEGGAERERAAIVELLKQRASSTTDRDLAAELRHVVRIVERRKTVRR